MTSGLTRRQKYLRIRLSELRNELLQRQDHNVKEYENMTRYGNSGDDVAREMALGLADFMDITSNVIEMISKELAKIEEKP